MEILDVHTHLAKSGAHPPPPTVSGPSFSECHHLPTYTGSRYCIHSQFLPSRYKAGCGSMSLYVVEWGGSGVQGQPWLLNEFEVSLGYLRFGVKQNKKPVSVVPQISSVFLFSIITPQPHLSTPLSFPRGTKQAWTEACPLPSECPLSVSPPPAGWN